MKATKIPTKSRALVKERARNHCERCGGPNASHWHHRRSRSVRDELTHSPANGVWLDSLCHAWVHARPLEAQAEGFILSRYKDPREHPIKHWSLGWTYLFDDGTLRAAAPPEVYVVDQLPR